MTARLPANLDAVLAEIEAGARREDARTGEFADPEDVDIVLWGAGLLGRKTLAGLRRLGRNVVAFVDTAPALQGTTVEGVSVLAPENAAARHPDAWFVLSIWSLGSERRHSGPRMALAALGVRKVSSFVPLFRSFPALFLPHHRIDRLSSLSRAEPQLRTAFGLLRDEASKVEFIAQIQALADPDLEGGELPSPAPPPTHFPTDLFRLGPGERFVDGGAFDGDTLRDFMTLVEDGPARAWAFEPDPENHRRLTQWVEALPDGLRRRITTRHAALGEHPGTLRFEARGTEGARVSADGADLVPCTSLDEDLGDEQVTIVKMDIEGAELDALKGSELVLRRDGPIVAICVYHLQSHLWEVPLRLAAILPDHRLFLRRHVGRFVDIVCYAVPSSRLLSGAGS